MASAAVSVHEEQERVRDLVIRHGWNATAFQTLEPGYRYFFHGAESCVAYVDTGAAWVAAGAPIAPAEDLADVVKAFVHAAREAGRRACFFSTEERLIASTGGALRSLGIGEQPVWDPHHWRAILTQHRSVREQLRRARAKGVRIRQLSAAELEAGHAHDQIARLASRWLGTRGMAPMGFLVRLEPFTFPYERRCFVAEIEDRVVAFAGVIPVPGRGGWFLEDLVRDPSAPNGTGELLVDAVMRWASEAGSTWVTFGLAPLAGALPSWLRLIRNRSRMLYDFEGLRAYKAKFRPDSWLPIFLSYPAKQSLVASIVDSLAAFTRDGFVRFAWRSLLRGPRVVLGALAILLVPWTLLLALAPAERWFGAAWVKWAWVVFDVAVALGLFRVLRKPSSRLLDALGVAVTMDAIVTTLQAVVWNVPHARSPFDVLVIITACIAPALAAVVLWGARRQRTAADGSRWGRQRPQTPGLSEDTP